MALEDVRLRKIGPLKSSPLISRHPQNPIMNKDSVPYEAELVFNAGVCKYQGKYVMVFRNDYNYTQHPSLPDKHYFADAALGLAFSDNGIDWDVEPKPCLQIRTDEFNRVYDPRLTVVDGRVLMCAALETWHGECGCVFSTDDFEEFELLNMTVPDNRNMVMFPEKIKGRYCRLERPFPVYCRGCGDRFDTWISYSPDLRYWGDSKLLMGVEDVPFANDKIGPGAPPVRTESGWLTTFHAVDVDQSRGKNGWEDTWKKRYFAGIMLLDLEDPGKVIGMSRAPLLAPEVSYEIDGGYRNNVIFPGGMILEDSGEVKIYYGAADTVECLATAHVNDLIGLCEPCDLPRTRYV